MVSYIQLIPVSQEFIPVPAAGADVRDSWLRLRRRRRRILILAGQGRVYGHGWLGKVVQGVDDLGESLVGRDGKCLMKYVSLFG